MLRGRCMIISFSIYVKPIWIHDFFQPEQVWSSPYYAFRPLCIVREQESLSEFLYEGHIQVKLQILYISILECKFLLSIVQDYGSQTSVQYQLLAIQLEQMTFQILSCLFFIFKSIFFYEIVFYVYFLNVFTT